MTFINETSNLIFNLLRLDVIVNFSLEVKEGCGCKTKKGITPNTINCT